MAMYIQQADLTRGVDKDFVNGLIFFRRLAAMLGERLVESYARYEKVFSQKTYI